MRIATPLHSHSYLPIDNTVTSNEEVWRAGAGHNPPSVTAQLSSAQQRSAQLSSLAFHMKKKIDQKNFLVEIFF
jgi:hypothetical protein